MVAELGKSWISIMVQALFQGFNLELGPFGKFSRFYRHQRFLVSNSNLVLSKVLKAHILFCQKATQFFF